MAPGAPDVVRVEVMLFDGVWTDVSAHVAWVAQPPQVTIGRRSEYEDIQPGVFTFGLRNVTGEWTPGNPLSSRYPLWAVGHDVRLTVVKGAATSTRFLGTIRAIDPDYSQTNPQDSIVTVTATDRLGDLALRTLGDEFVERWLWTQRLGNGVDLWPFDETADTPTVLRNAGGGRPGTVIASRKSLGSWSMGGADGIMLSRSWQSQADNLRGPVAVLPVTVTPRDILVPFRTSELVDYTTSLYKVIASGLDAAGRLLWSLRLVQNGSGASAQTDLNLYDGSESFVATLKFEFASAGASSGDDNWHVLEVYANGPNAQFLLYRTAPRAIIGGATMTLSVLTSTAQIVLGGRPTASPGLQTRCVNAQFGAVVASDNVSSHFGYLCLDQAEPAQTRFADLCGYANIVGTVTGTTNRVVALAPLAGQTAFDALATLVRTVGGAAQGDYTNDAVRFIDSDSARQVTPLVSLDAAADLDVAGGFAWRYGVDQRPNRVTATWPGGSTTIDGQIDDLTPIRDTSVDTTGAVEDDALDVASTRLWAHTRLSVTQLAVDLVTAANDLYGSGTTAGGSGGTGGGTGGGGGTDPGSGGGTGGGTDPGGSSGTITHGSDVRRDNVGAFGVFTTDPRSGTTTRATIPGFTAAAGQTITYTDKLITGRIKADAGSVVSLTNCVILQDFVNPPTNSTAHGLWLNGGAVTLTNVTILGPNYLSRGIYWQSGSLVANSLCILGFGDGIQISNETTGTLPLPSYTDPDYPDFTGARGVVTDFYIGDGYREAGVHSDGIQIDGGGRIIFKRGNIQAHRIVWPAQPVTTVNTDPSDIRSGGLILTQNAASPKQIDRVGLYDCLLDGANQTIDTGPTDGLLPTNVFVRGNKLGSTDGTLTTYTNAAGTATVTDGAFTHFCRFTATRFGSGTTATNNTWYASGYSLRIGNSTTAPTFAAITAGGPVS